MRLVNIGVARFLFVMIYSTLCTPAPRIHWIVPLPPVAAARGRGRERAGGNAALTEMLPVVHPCLRGQPVPSCNDGRRRRGYAPVRASFPLSAERAGPTTLRRPAGRTFPRPTLG